MPSPSRLPGVVRVERQYAWLMALAVVTGLLGATGNVVFRTAIGGAVALFARLSTEQRKVLIACGAAAGIATTFNAPLGALMFAQEIVLLGEMQLANLSLIVVATTTAVIAARGLFGNAPVFTVP